MTGSRAIEWPLLWRVVRRCSVPLAANLVLFALDVKLDQRLSFQTQMAIGKPIADLGVLLFLSPILISAWTVARWEDEPALPYARSVLNAWLGTAIALAGTGLAELVLPLLREGDLLFGWLILAYSVLFLPPIAAATWIFRAAVRRRTAAIIGSSTD